MSQEPSRQRVQGVNEDARSGAIEIQLRELASGFDSLVARLSRGEEIQLHHLVPLRSRVNEIAKWSDIDLTLPTCTVCKGPSTVNTAPRLTMACREHRHRDCAALTCDGWIDADGRMVRCRCHCHRQGGKP